MKLLHTSDLHLGLQLMGKSLLGAQTQMVDYLIETAREEEVDAVLISGDVFDRAVSSAEAIALYNRLMTSLCLEEKKQVIVIAGNHDGAERLASCSELLKSAGLHLFGRLQLPLPYVDLQKGRERARIFAMPYYNADEVRAALSDESIGSAGEAAARAIATAKLLENETNVLLAHCFVAGAQTSESDRSAVVGGSAAIDAALFSGFDYAALGHLHRPQRFENAAYSGTPLKYSFAEVEQEKGFVLFDTQTKTQKHIPIPEFCKLRVLRGTGEALREEARKEGKREEYIKLELTDEPAGQSALDYFREYYPNLMMVTGVLAAGEGNGLTLEETQRLSPADILRRFCEEQTGQTPDREMIEWFETAMREADTSRGQ